MAITKDTQTVEASEKYHTIKAPSGKEITIRDMYGRDMVKFEKMLSKKGATKMGATFELLAYLSCPPYPISLVDVEKLSSRDVLDVAKQMNEITGMVADEVVEDDDDSF